MAIRFASPVVALFALFVLCVPTLSAAEPVGVAVDRVAGQVIGGRQLFSSTQLAVRWTPSGSDQTHHFEIVARESVQGTEGRASAAASASTMRLTGLKAATTYAIIVFSCRDDACTQSTSSSSVSGQTDTEYWQFHGTGNTVDRLTKAVSDGNARLSATRFGPDAGEMANRVQLYYGPLNSARQSPLAAAVASGPADANDPDSFLTFSSRAGSSGLLSPGSPSPLIASVATGQGVPLATTVGGRVRLFFEAQGADNRTRIMSIDSQDGYAGLDFNAGAAATCSTAADYSAGGGCVPMVAIGVDGDANGNARIMHARQFKVAWPTLESPHWDMAIGTFMVFTSDRVTGCSDYQQNHGYAVWDGATWRVEYQSNGCPKLFTSAQAAFPFHSGGRPLPPLLRRSIHHRRSRHVQPAVPRSEETDLRRRPRDGRAGTGRLRGLGGAIGGARCRVSVAEWRSDGRSR